MGKTYDEASKVGSEDGDVTVNGPDGIAVSMTPEAAAETGDRLIGAAAEAHGQTLRSEMRKRDRPQPDLLSMLAPRSLWAAVTDTGRSSADREEDSTPPASQATSGVPANTL